MGCGCGGNLNDPNTILKVKLPDGSMTFSATIAEARVHRGLAGPATIIMRVPVTDADYVKWLEAQAQGDAGALQ